MRSLLILLIVGALLFGAYHFYLSKLPATDGGTAPTQAISLTAVRSNLLQIAQGERAYMAFNGRCVGLDELISSSTVKTPNTDRSGYTYSIECSDNNFDVKAQHASATAGSSLRYPNLVIDSNMQIQEVN
jgi:hypothetical protein